MKKIIFVILAILFPCVIFFSKDLPSAGVVAIVLQVSIIAWPIAILWALKTVFKSNEKATK